MPQGYAVVLIEVLSIANELSLFFYFPYLREYYFILKIGFQDSISSIV